MIGASAVRGGGVRGGGVRGGGVIVPAWHMFACSEV